MNIPRAVRIRHADAMPCCFFFSAAAADGYAADAAMPRLRCRAILRYCHARFRALRYNIARRLLTLDAMPPLLPFFRHATFTAAAIFS